MAQKKSYWVLLHLFISVAALSHPMSVVVVASLIPLSFKIVLKFYNILNEKQARALSLLSLLLLPHFPPLVIIEDSGPLPPWWKNFCVTPLIFHLHPPQCIWGFLRLHLSAPINGRLPGKIIKGENVLWENLFLHSFPMDRNDLWYLQW